MIKIKTKHNFSRSTNIKIDFADKKYQTKVILSDKFQRRFIDIAGPLSNSNSNQRAHVIAGTPGTGKSTFAVFLAKNIATVNKKTANSTIRRQVVSKEFNQLWEKICKVSYLPIFLNGNEGKIEDAFYSALKETFCQHGWKKQFEQLSCSTQALEIVNNWQKNYPQKHQELISAVEKKYKTTKQFIDALQKNRRYAQNDFSQLYQQITGGATIGWRQHDQVVELYRKATIFLQDEMKYAGLFVIYDEFGKYLEQATRYPHSFDLQFLQDLAETCNKSGKRHMHLLLITHLPISQYATQLSVAVQQQWQKIEGRFQHLSFNSGNESNYTIISSVFDSNASQCHKKLPATVNKWQKQNDSLGNLSKCSAKTLLDCYPLHPLVVGLLSLLSEKIAQNERTMFSFLTRNEEFSLPRYLQTTTLLADKLQFMPLFYLLYYFYPLVASSSNGRQKILVDRILNDIDNELPCTKDLASLLVIADIINNRPLLKINNQSALTLLYGMYSSEEIKQALDFLQKNKIIVLDRVKQVFVLYDSSSLDLTAEISKAKQTSLTAAGYTQVLKNNFLLSFVIPKKYNFNNGITRYYREQLLSIEELENRKYQINYDKEDGRIFYLVPFNCADLCRIEKILRQISLPSALFVTSNEPLEITDELLELHAIDQLYSRKDLLAEGIATELDRHRQTSRELIKKSLLKIHSYSQMDASVYYLGKKAKITNLAQLSQLASKISAREYYKYPIFYNEMLNKHKASTPLIQGRSRFIEASYFSQNIETLIIDGGGPDFAIYTALFATNNFKKKANGQLTLKSDSALTPLFADFCYLLKNQHLSMNDLISRWQKPPFGVRLSLIPLYVSIFARLTPSPLSFFYDGIYVEKIDTDLFEGLIRHPKKYSMRMVVVDSTKRDYLQRLHEKFTTHLPGATDEFLASFVHVAKTVSHYYSLIPSYTRRHEILTTRSKKLVTTIGNLCQPEEFFLVDLPSIYCQKPFSKLKYTEKQLFLQELDNDLALLFNCYVNLLKRLAQRQQIALNKLQNSTGVVVAKKIIRGAPLAKYWKTFIQALADDVVKFPFSNTTLHFVNRIMQFNDNTSNQLVVENIADALTGANPKNWSDKGEVLFNFNLQRTVTEIEEVNHLLTRSTKNIVRISNLKRGNNEPIVYELVQAELNHEKHSSLLESLLQHLSHLPDAEKTSVLLALIKRINNKELPSPSKVSDEVSIGEAWG